MVLVKMQQNIMTYIMIMITLPKKYLVLLKIKIFHVMTTSLGIVAAMEPLEIVSSEKLVVIDPLKIYNGERDKKFHHLNECDL